MSSTGSPAPAPASVSTHVLDTGTGRPARGVAVHLASRTGGEAEWRALGGSTTDADGRCKDLPALPQGTTHVRLDFRVGAYVEEHFAGGAFFPEVTVTFTVAPGEHHHVPLLLSPYGYSVYRGS
ncbi:5-hydroxyisourate hydrolase [Streptomyces ruber]|uniref:5-hydroxyisourate hydrolase n=2 Tax=Streptomyces TaxID=1883 RepID=A0A918BB04_9ACTN|nr:hydroxyisourate hydrolase [Streptomyces ruber]GGQ46501.1 5-hydroxyisourate hydrolase [Streptomyces ruber]